MIPSSVWSSSPGRGDPAGSGGPAPATGTRKARAPLPDILVAVGKLLVREGLVRLLEGGGLAARVRASADASQTRGWLRSARFDLVLLDPQQATGLELPERPLARQRTLLVTAREHAGEAPLAGRDAACGMLSETLDPARTMALLHTVAACPIVAFGRQCCGGCLARRTLEPAGLPLSPREREVFLRIGAGAGPARIAAELGLSVKTVESHREKIKHKLGLDSADALLCAAARWRQGYRLE